MGNPHLSVRQAKKAVKKKSKKKSENRAGTKGVRSKSSSSSASGRSSLFPWVLLLFAVAGGCFGGYYMFQKYEMAQDEIAQAHAATDEVRQRAVDADHKIMALQAQLSRASGEFGASIDINPDQAAQLNALTDDLKDMVKADQVELFSSASGRVNLRLSGAALFSSDKSRLTDGGRAVLQKVGATFKALSGNQIWVRSHVAGEQASSWDASAQRALAVVSFLQSETEVPSQRLAAVAGGHKASGADPHIEFILAPEQASIHN